MLVSIGYAACHWCHVMEHESFEDADVALVMNTRFVCVKVDREERPDVDAIYMDAVQAMTGQGGWPLNAFLTPEGVPFFAGTYFPPEPRHGMPSWRDVLDGVVRTRGRRSATEIDEAAQQNVPRLQGAAASWRRRTRERRRPSLWTRGGRRCGAQFDDEHGGWGGAPKFPATSVIEFLLARGERAMPLQTLRRMAVRRHLRPGRRRLRPLLGRRALARPALREDALRQRAAGAGLPARVPGLRRGAVPARVRGDARLGDARAAPGRGRLRVVAGRGQRGRRGQVLRLDAGRDPCGARRRSADAAIAHFGVTEAGNFEGANILVRATSDPPELAEIKAGLLAARAARVRPALDDKRLTSWNALMISALADAGAALERADYVAAAVACARFIEARAAGCRRPPAAHVQPRPREAPGVPGGPRLPARGVPDAVRGDVRRASGSRARSRWPTTILERFYDPERGGFFSVADDHTGLIARRKDLEDAPIPSRRLGRLLRPAAARADDRRVALRGRGAVADPAAAHGRPEHPLAFGHLLRAIDFYLGAGARGRRWPATTCGARAGRPRRVPPARRAGRRRRRRPAARGARTRSTARPPPTCASTSPAACPSPRPRS